MTDSQLYQVPENETTVSHLVDVANLQHMFWVSGTSFSLDFHAYHLSQKYLTGHIPFDLIWVGAHVVFRMAVLLTKVFSHASSFCSIPSLSSVSSQPC